MRIKRFIAPDMRTALRMVRDEQGPDAVILSNRAVDGGIEVVAATDYDEALVAQALRAAAPGLDATLPPMVAVSATTANGSVTIATRAQPTPVPAFASLLSTAEPAATSAIASAAEPVHAPTTATATAAIATAHSATTPAVHTSIAAPARESLMSRARAVFKMGEAPTLAELTAAPHIHSANRALTASAAAAANVAQAPSSPIAAMATDATATSAETTAPPTRFEAMMAALNPATAMAANESTAVVAQVAGASIEAAPVAMATGTPAGASDADYLISLSSGATTPSTTSAATSINSAPASIATATADDVAAITANVTTRALQAVTTTANTEQPDPTIVAMRDDLASMRQLMEKQMEQLSLERLRGSPARAAAYQAMIGYGCEDVLAQAVAARIDPRLPPAEILEPMFAELARMLTVARSEPLDDGGVIALVGPTGAGKTTTAAKLAARFAARHRARDVALVTTDGERAGAREQLHAHGRRLGITVCEAAGPEGLQDALAQLTDYPLVLVDTTGYAPRDRALFSQILWLRAARKVRSLLVLPANAHPHDLGEVIRRYRPAAPEAVVLTKLDETGRLGSALSVTVRHGLTLAYTTHGQQVPSDIDTADATRLARTLEKLRRAADNPLATEDCHAHA